MALKKLCPKCNKVIEYNQKYCNECESKVRQSKRERDRWYDKNVRDPRTVELYNSKEWEQVKAVVRTRDNGLCQLSLEDNEIVFGDIFHHIISVEDCWDMRLDPDNVILLSTGKHNTVHAEYKRSKESKLKMQEKLRSLIKKSK